MESKKFLNAEEVAEEFGLDAEALKQLVDSGDVRALADRGTWKYRRDELQALVDGGRIPSQSSSDANQVLSFQDPDDVSYIELDEEALAEQATMITKSDKGGPEAPAEEPDWFVPSEAAEMASPTAQSSSDVAIYPGPSDDSPSIAAGSDSDVQIAPDYDAPRAEDSGILLDFNLDAGATVSSSGSSLRLPQTAPGNVDDVAESDDADESAWDDISATGPSAESGILGNSDGGSSIRLGDDAGQADSSVRLGDESAVRLADVTGSGVKLPIEESGILLDEGSHIGMSEGSSVVGGPRSGIVADSGIALDSGNDDSGITLDSPGDSGTRRAGSRITVGDPDSGISLSAGDSGIALGSADSGISLDAGDSGLSLDSGGESGISIGNAQTMADDDFNIDGDQTQTLNLMGESDDDSSFDINLDDGDATAELLLGDDDDADDVSATVIRKGRPAPGSLSAAFELDDAAEVEDLEISQDLDAGVDDELEELSGDDDVFDASEETFSGDEVEASSDDDYLEPETKAKKPAGPREPAWGAGMAIGLIACTLFLAANTVILWTGVSTMWNGADSEGPGGTLVQTFGDLLGK